MTTEATEEDWPELYEKAFLELIELHPYLFSHEHPLHLNINARHNALYDIQNKLRARFPDINWTEEKLLNKWKNLIKFYLSVKSGKYKITQSSRAERRHQLLTFLNQKLYFTSGNDLITEFIPLESLETEYLPNSVPLYQTEHNEHDYISTVFIGNAHEEIVSSTCDETTIMKTKKDGDKRSSSSISALSIDSMPLPQKLNTQVVTTKSKSNSYVPANIIFSDKTLNTIVLAPASSASNSARVNRLPASSNVTQSKTTVCSSKLDGQSSNIPGLSYALYPSASFNNTPSVSSALRGTRTSTILCSSVSPIVSTKTQTIHSLTSSSCSPVKKIILQKPVFSKGVSPTIQSGAFVEIHSPPPMVSSIATTNPSFSASSPLTSTISSPSRTRSGASNSSQTIVIYTSPSVSSSMSSCLATSKNVVKTTSPCSTAQNSSALRTAPSVAATASRTIVIGTCASSLSNSNNITSALRATGGNLSLRAPSSHNGGKVGAINISKHVGTNTTHHIAQRSIGINTQLPLMHNMCGNSAVTSMKEGCNLHSITSSKTITMIPTASIITSSGSTKVLSSDSDQLKVIDTMLTAKNLLKRPRDVSPSSPLSFTDENESLDNSAFRGGKRECCSDVGFTTPEVSMPSIISNSDEQIVGSCPSSTNRELQVAIVGGDDADPLNTTDAEFVHSELIKQLKNTLEKSDSLELRFQNSGMVEPGWYMCTCQDSTSLEWLLSLKAMRTPDGRPLQIFRANELPWPSQVGFRILGKDVDPVSVLSLLQGQNKKLMTRKWKILEKREESNGAFLIYFIDPDSVKALEVYQWTLCYEFTTIQVHLFRGTGDTWRVKKEHWKMD